MFFWQKKEVLVTFSLEDFCRVKEALAANHMEYDWRIKPEAGSGRDRTMGTAFMDQTVLRQYYLYVKRRDYEKAEVIMRQELVEKKR